MLGLKREGDSYERSELLANAEDSLLLVIDVQEKILPPVQNQEKLLQNISILTNVAHHMKIPVAASQQYSKGLGNTVPEVGLEEGDKRFEKLTFSLVPDDGALEFIKQQNKKQIFLAGIETHVCILQTALDLLKNTDCWIYIVADAASARADSSHELALSRARVAGVNIVNTEMVSFEWLRRAGTPMFKEILQFFK